MPRHHYPTGSNMIDLRGYILVCQTKHQQNISGGAGGSNCEGREGKGKGGGAAAAVSREQELEQLGMMVAKAMVVMMVVVKMLLMSMTVVVTKVIHDVATYLACIGMHDNACCTCSTIWSTFKDEL